MTFGYSAGLIRNKSQSVSKQRQTNLSGTKLSRSTDCQPTNAENLVNQPECQKESLNCFPSFPQGTTDGITSDTNSLQQFAALQSKPSETVLLLRCSWCMSFTHARRRQTISAQIQRTSMPSWLSSLVLMSQSSQERYMDRSLSAAWAA